MTDLRAQVLDDLANGRFEYMGDAVSAARAALTATPAVGILSREKSDRVLSECGYEPVAPAVGVEALQKALTEWFNGLDSDFLNTPTHRRIEYEAMIKCTLAAAQPAFPLRGREPETLGGQINAIYGNLDAEDCARIDREWMKMRGINAAQPASPLQGRGKFDAWFNSHFLDPDGGSTHLPDWLKDDLRSAWDAASVSPPEQPAADPVTEDELTKIMDEAWPDGHRAIAKKIMERLSARETSE
jgi:hypothetical protein